MGMRDKLLMIWAIVLITCLLMAFGYWIGEKADTNAQIEDTIFDDDSLIIGTTDSSILMKYVPSTAIVFGENIGKISWDNGVMIFEGNAEVSADLFFAYVLKPMIDEYIKSEMEKEKDFHKKEWIDPGINDTGSQKPDTYFNSDWGIIEEPEEILFEFTTGGVLKDNFKPQLFLKITNTDLSRCFIDGRLKVDDEWRDILGKIGEVKRR